MIITGVITVLTVAAMMVSTSALFVAGLVGTILLILTGGVSEKEAFVSADIKLLILIASFGVISKSISNTGGDRLIAQAGGRERQPCDGLCLAVHRHLRADLVPERYRGHRRGEPHIPMVWLFRL